MHSQLGGARLLCHSPCSELHLEQQQVVGLCQLPQPGHQLGRLPVPHARVMQPPGDQHVRVAGPRLHVVHRAVALHALVKLFLGRIAPPGVRKDAYSCFLRLAATFIYEMGSAECGQQSTHSSNSMVVRGIVSSSMVVRQSTKGTWGSIGMGNSMSGLVGINKSQRKG